LIATCGNALLGFVGVSVSGTCVDIGGNPDSAFGTATLGAPLPSLREVGEQRSP